MITFFEWQPRQFFYCLPFSATPCNNYFIGSIAGAIDIEWPFSPTITHATYSIFLSEDLRSETNLRMWYSSRLDDNGYDIRMSADTSTYRHRDAPPATQSTGCASTFHHPPATSVVSLTNII